MKAATLLLVGSVALLGTGCSDVLGADNELRSSLKDYNLGFDKVRILDQSDAIIIRYIRTTNVEQWPTVVVANKPIEVGKSVDLVLHGGVHRKTSNNVEWPDMTVGTITFDELGPVGSQASGVFYGTFEGGGTLNGKFSGTVQTGDI